MSVGNDEYLVLVLAMVSKDRILAVQFLIMRCICWLPTCNKNAELKYFQVTPGAVVYRYILEILFRVGHILYFIF